jgi:hypothetical protein
MVVSSAGFRSKSDSFGKAQKQLYSKLQTHPLVREGALHQETCSRQKDVNIWCSLILISQQYISLALRPALNLEDQVPQWQVDLFITRSTVLIFRQLLRLTGLGWRYCDHIYTRKYMYMLNANKVCIDYDCKYFKSKGHMLSYLIGEAQQIRKRNSLMFGALLLTTWCTARIATVKYSVIANWFIITC